MTSLSSMIMKTKRKPYKWFNLLHTNCQRKPQAPSVHHRYRVLMCDNLSLSRSNANNRRSSELGPSRFFSVQVKAHADFYLSWWERREIFFFNKWYVWGDLDPALEILSSLASKEKTQDWQRQFFLWKRPSCVTLKSWTMTGGKPSIGGKTDFQCLWNWVVSELSELKFMQCSTCFYTPTVWSHTNV